MRPSTWSHPVTWERVISGVTCCIQPKCWLIGIRLVTKLNCGQICCTCTPTCVGSVPHVVEKFSSIINIFNLSSIKGQFLNSCPICSQYVHVNASSTMGWVVVNGIFCWTSGHSTIPMTNTLGQTIWWSGCVCWTTIRVAIASTDSTSCCKLNLSEGIFPNYIDIPTRLKVGYTPILNMLGLDSKQEPIQMYSNHQSFFIERVQ